MSESDNLTGVRAKYNSPENLFLEKNIAVKEPWNLFEQWFQDARNNAGIIEPHAACISTATKDGVPSSRMVLCKAFGIGGFKFFTHYTSRKGQELKENPRAALTFFWASLSRMVRVEGIVERLPLTEADEYFKTRPYKSQVGANCSNQSFAVESREALNKKVQECMKKYPEGTPVPRPEQWGGYILKPHYFEFWHGQSDRVHDRIVLRRPTKDSEPDNKFTHPGEDGWIYERLSP